MEARGEEDAEQPDTAPAPPETSVGPDTAQAEGDSEDRKRRKIDPSKQPDDFPPIAVVWNAVAAAVEHRRAVKDLAMYPEDDYRPPPASMPRCTRWTQKRGEMYRQRVKDIPELEEWSTCLELGAMILTSPFLLGQVKDGRNWHITLDALLERRQMIVRVLEGYYHTRHGGIKADRVEYWRNWLRSWCEEAVGYELDMGRH
jgi:hypothetical protein